MLMLIGYLIGTVVLGALFFSLITNLITSIYNIGVQEKEGYRK